MLVIADQDTLGIGGQRGFAGARQAEEDRGIIRIVLRVVGGAVHRHDALARQDVVEDGENALLDFTGIGGVADQDQFFLEGNRDHGFGAAPVALGVRLEGRAVDDGEVGLERLDLVQLGPAQHVVDEQGVPCQLGDDAHIQAMGRIGAAEQVVDEILAALHVFEHIRMQAVESVGRHRFVVFPPDGIFDRRLANDEFVVGRAAGVLAGGHEERAAVTDFAFAACNGFLYQGCELQIVMGCFDA